MKIPLTAHLFSLIGVVSVIFALPLRATGADAGSAPSAAPPIPIQQKTDDLLSGTHRAICYSGFRAGQHPDRGEGAINPSDQEILEDLRILSDQCHYSMIRLYDSQINSEAVLRLIESFNAPKAAPTAPPQPRADVAQAGAEAAARIARSEV